MLLGLAPCRGFPHGADLLLQYVLDDDGELGEYGAGDRSATLHEVAGHFKLVALTGTPEEGVLSVSLGS